MTIEEFFGTLQQSITKEWRDHLQASKYSSHEILDLFYKEMPEKVDALIEAYQADNEVVKGYKNILDEGMDALEYLEALKKLTKEGRELLGSSELESLTDDIIGLIDSTIYKLKHLKESMTSLTDYLKESLGKNSLIRTIDESVLDANPTAKIDADMDKWSKIVGIVQATLDKGSMQNMGSCWKFSERPDYKQIESLVKKIKPKKFTKSDNLLNQPFIGFQVLDGEFNNMIFYGGDVQWPKIRPHQSSAYTSGVSIGFSFAMEQDLAWRWLDTRGMRGCRRTAYECPVEIVQQIYDMVKAKY